MRVFTGWDSNLKLICTQQIFTFSENHFQIYSVRILFDFFTQMKDSPHHQDPRHLKLSPHHPLYHHCPHHPENCTCLARLYIQLIMEREASCPRTKEVYKGAQIIPNLVIHEMCRSQRKLSNYFFNFQIISIIIILCICKCLA